jgi:hypothetical protein
MPLVPLFETVEWELVTTTASDAESYRDTGLEGETEYTYRIRAVNAVDESAYTNQAADTTAQLLRVGAVPHPVWTVALPILIITGTEVVLSDEETIGLVWRVGDAELSNWTLVHTAAADEEGYTDTGLTPLTSYTYRVRGINLDDGSYSNEATTTTGSGLSFTSPKLTWRVGSAMLQSAATLPNVAPGAIWRVATINFGNRLRGSVPSIAWHADDGTVWILVDTVAANAELYTDTGLEQGTTYTYRVRAISPFFGSGYTNTATATTFAESATGPAPSLVWGVGEAGFAVSFRPAWDQAEEVVLA